MAQRSTYHPSMAKDRLVKKAGQGLSCLLRLAQVMGMFEKRLLRPTLRETAERFAEEAPQTS